MKLATPERISIELSTKCQKACSFCYNESSPDSTDRWEPSEMISFIKDVSRHGTKAVSLGGGEPLEYDGLEEIFESLRNVVFLSMTSNGLLLDQQWSRVSKLNPDKIHLSIHFPERKREVDRVIRQVLQLRKVGLRAGVNFLIRRSEIDVAVDVGKQLRKSGIQNESIMYLPMRGADTPSPKQVAAVAGNTSFQSMTCLESCGVSERFCSIDAQKRVAHCSYTVSRRALGSLDAEGLTEALDDLSLKFCG